MKHHTTKGLCCLLATSALCLAADLPVVPTLPTPARPDGKEADMSKPIQVYILMGQSNMVGMGEVGDEAEGSLKYAIKTKTKYPYLPGKVVPGYRGTPEIPKGNGQKVEGAWYAGKQYDDDTEYAKSVLAQLDTYC